MNRLFVIRLLADDDAEPERAICREFDSQADFVMPKVDDGVSKPFDTHSALEMYLDDQNDVLVLLDIDGAYVLSLLPEGSMQDAFVNHDEIAEALSAFDNADPLRFCGKIGDQTVDGLVVLIVPNDQDWVMEYE